MDDKSRHVRGAAAKQGGEVGAGNPLSTSLSTPLSIDAFSSFVASSEGALDSSLHDGILTVSQSQQVLARFRYDDVLTVREWHCDGAQATRAVLAALDALFAHGAADRAVPLRLEAPRVEAALLAAGAALPTPLGLHASADMLWQIPSLWCADARPAYPVRHVMSDGKRHPLRPPKPRGVVYARHIPWLGRTLTLRTAALERDLPLLHRWMNDPEVDRFWQEAGDIDKHRAYLAGLIADPHMLPLIAAFDDEPFGYFELYWARENRIAPFYDAHDHDRGWHVLIGEPAFRGKAYLTAWFPSIQHFQFLDDPRTQRIVGEPRADHERQLANLDKAGFARLKTFDFPHKRAVLVMLLREQFFGERLLLPRTASAPQPSCTQ